jgi:hypothetical protein
MKILCFTDFHSHRDYLLKNVFEFHPAMVNYLTNKYSQYLHGSRDPVSVHFRLGGTKEIDKQTYSIFPHPSIDWYKHIMTMEFDPSQVYFLIFADDVEQVQFILAGFNIADIRYHIVEEDFANSMLLMSLCTHHIAAASTFSFWGAYLDKKQPHGGRVYFPPEFQITHCTRMPFAEWKVISLPGCCDFSKYKWVCAT